MRFSKSVSWGVLGETELLVACVPYVHADILDADIKFNLNYDWIFTPPKTWREWEEQEAAKAKVFSRVFLHEVGHAVGLLHDDTPAIMRKHSGNLHVGHQVKPSVSFDDYLGLAALYGKDGNHKPNLIISTQRWRSEYGEFVIDEIPQEVSPGDEIYVKNLMFNMGAGGIDESIQVKVYASRDRVFDDYDLYIGQSGIYKNFGSGHWAQPKSHIVFYETLAGNDWYLIFTTPFFSERL